MNTKYIEFNNCLILEIDNLIHIERDNKPDLFKRTLSIQTEDKQLFFGEVRNNNLRFFEQKGIKNGDKVNVKISLQGSVKDSKKYNNVFIAEIDKV
jgi:hypothetical protein